MEKKLWVLVFLFFLISEKAILAKDNAEVDVSIVDPVEELPDQDELKQDEIKQDDSKSESDEGEVVPSLIEQTKEDIIEKDDNDEFVEDEEEAAESDVEAAAEYEGDDLGEPDPEPSLIRKENVAQTTWYQKVFGKIVPSSSWCGRWI